MNILPSVPSINNLGVGVGYSLIPLYVRMGRFWTREQIYQFALTETPLEYVDSDGARWQCDKKHETDLGSVPWFVRPWFPHDEFPASYAMHDGLYLYGAAWRDGIKIEIERDVADEILFQMCMIEGRQKNTNIKMLRDHCSKIYFAVRLGGGRYWKRAKQK